MARLTDEALSMVHDLANELMDGVQRGAGDRAIQGALVSAALDELRQRRSHDRELVRLVKECRESHRLFGEHSSRRVTALLDLLDRIGEANE